MDNCVFEGGKGWAISKNNSCTVKTSGKKNHARGAMGKKIKQVSSAILNQ